MADRQALIRELYVYRYYIAFAAAATYYFRRLYRQIYMVPENLSHIPSIPYGELFKSLGNNEPLLKRTKKLVFPILFKANGIYLVCYIVIHSIIFVVTEFNNDNKWMSICRPTLITYFFPLIYKIIE